MSIADDIARAKNEEAERKKLKILIFDIETAPSLALVWSIWQENIPLERLLESGQIICFAAMWYGSDEVIFHSDFHDGHEEMVRALWALFNEADIIVGYNSGPFDIKHSNREFFLQELPPPSPYKSVDLLTVMRGNFKFQSNKLEYILRETGIGEKIKHKGFQLWLDCMSGDPVAWEDMRIYNVGDIIGTRDLYTRVIPWIKNHPLVYPIQSEDELACPRCGSTNLTQDGTVPVSLFEYPQYLCNDCGGWLKGKEGNRISNLRSI